MCNPKPSSPSPAHPCSCPDKTLFQNPTKLHIPGDIAVAEHNDRQHLHRWPTLYEAVEEMKAIGKISGPTAVTGLLLYSRAFVSMLFLGYLGELELAGGSLAMGFANITGYSIIAGLAMGMDPICGQAHGADRRKLLGLTLQKTVLLLIATSVPICFAWVNISSILLWCGQDPEIARAAHTFLVFCIPDLFLLSLLHPLRVYLRTQGVTLPITYCSAASVLLHVPLNYLLISRLEMGIAGVAIAMVWTNLNLLLLLSSYLLFFFGGGDAWVAPSSECLKGWSGLLGLAVPSCASVCLEWWWYEFMILLCGLLENSKATVASMGILIQTTSLVYVFPSSLSLGVSTRVGNKLGANRPDQARNATIVSLGCSAAMGLGAAAFARAMRHRWGGLFTDDGEILELTAAALPIVGLCELGNCPQTTACGVLRGSARPAMGANINLGAFYLVGMPVAVYLGFGAKMGFVGLWLGMLTAQVSCAGMMLCVLCVTDWRAQAERARQLTQQEAASASPEAALLLPVTVTANSIINNHINNDTGKKAGNKMKPELDVVLCAPSLQTEPLVSDTEARQSFN